jgi:hypothetical protein
MSKLIESFLADALDRAKTPEVRGVLQKTILTPLLSTILEYLSPYLVAVGLLWGLMFLGIFAILVILMRHPLVGV